MPALVVGSRDRAAIGWRSWALAGLLFGVANMILPWHGHLGGALIAAPLTVIGAVPAGRVWIVVERPTRGRVLRFVTLAGICAPAFTGVLVLALRSRTP